MEALMYNGQALTDAPLRKDGYYWVKLSVLNPIVAQYVSAIHPGSGKWYGFWRLPGHSINWLDGDFCFIGSKPLEVPAEIR